MEIISVFDLVNSTVLSPGAKLNSVYIFIL